MNELAPLAERLRPKIIEDLVGQEDLSGEKGILNLMLNTDNQPSIILWGPPGVGKTSIASILAQHKKRRLIPLSAISAGIKEVKQVINEASTFRDHPILFIDEIHRFNKSQQDALLGAVEKGVLSLLGATTENPSFEVNAALLSRSHVFKLNALTVDNISTLIDRALQKDELLSQYKIEIEDKKIFWHLSGGDARKVYNLLELACNYVLKKAEPHDNKIYTITNQIVQEISFQRMVNYDKSGEQHYDIVSALIKSVRGSDPQAAVYWLARMIVGGEDLKFIARRLVILAAEDIGLANPVALGIANSCFQSVNVIGYPEARIILSQCVVYLACSDKSNSTYLAIDQAIDCVKKTGDLPIPMHLRNAPTQLMKNMDYGKGYKYPHDAPGHFLEQEYLPEKLKNVQFYKPADNPREELIKKKLEAKGLL